MVVEGRRLGDLLKFPRQAHAAAVSNSSEIWSLLEDQSGYNFDARDAEGRTPLAYAALMGRPHALLSLLTVKAPAGTHTYKHLHTYSHYTLTTRPSSALVSHTPL